jgi:hypothetical protein
MKTILLALLFLAACGPATETGDTTLYETAALTPCEQAHSDMLSACPVAGVHIPNQCAETETLGCDSEYELYLRCAEALECDIIHGECDIEQDLTNEACQ